MGTCDSKENQNLTNNLGQNKIPNNNLNDYRSQPVQKIENEVSIQEKTINGNGPVDKIIEKLLSAKPKPPGYLVKLTEKEIRFIIDQSLPIIKGQRTLIELEASIRVCGDIHGQYSDLLRIFENYGYPNRYNYLFLGNYVDFGIQGIEVLCLLLSYKIKYPEKITLLRGNHESSDQNRIDGFYEECKRRYNVRIWRSFIDLFNHLPFAALIDEKIFCVHSGLSPDLKSFQDILDISRPTAIPECGLICNLLNSNPDKNVLDYDEDEKGILLFGEKILLDFMQKNKIDLIVRGNQCVYNGYEFFAQNKLVTIFSAPHFKSKDKNFACILIINENLKIHFNVLRPI